MSGFAARVAAAAWGAGAAALLFFLPAFCAGLATAAWGAGAVVLPGLAWAGFAGPLGFDLGVCFAPFDLGALVSLRCYV